MQDLKTISKLHKSPASCLKDDTSADCRSLTDFDASNTDRHQSVLTHSTITASCKLSVLRTYPDSEQPPASRQGANARFGRAKNWLGTMAFGQIFSKDTQAIFYNWKPNPVQRMLDFDFLCGRLARRWLVLFWLHIYYVRVSPIVCLSA